MSDSTGRTTFRNYSRPKGCIYRNFYPKTDRKITRSKIKQIIICYIYIIIHPVKTNGGWPHLPSRPCRAIGKGACVSSPARVSRSRPSSLVKSPVAHQSSPGRRNRRSACFKEGGVYASVLRHHIHLFLGFKGSGEFIDGTACDVGIVEIGRGGVYGVYGERSDGGTGA